MRLRFGRRAWLRLAVYGSMAGGLSYGHWIEPQWLRCRVIRLHPDPMCRLAHFSDLHYKGPAPIYEKVLAAINEWKPDFACFTGDLVEQEEYLKDALALIRKIRCPVFGVPGNHELWSCVLKRHGKELQAAFAETGGVWLENAEAEPRPGIRIQGLKGDDWRPPEVLHPEPARRILLCHYPEIVKRCMGKPYHAILAGHSHGGQVRLPFVGALVTPQRVGPYELGRYDTPAGPLHVSAGIGTYGLPIRFYCPPEITLIEV